jgi:CubicO group peptidase (beta-lactamase class C family)
MALDFRYLESSLNHPDQPISLILPEATHPFLLPLGWSIVEDAALPTVVGPEGDLRIAFLVLPTGGEPAEIALQAWRVVEEDFEQPIRQQTEAAAAGGWDATYQIVYLAAQSGGNMHIAILRRLGGQMYISLLSGTAAGFSRRGANVGEIVDGWRPDTLSEISLAGRPAASWTEELAAELRHFLVEALRTLKVPGASLAIVQDGRVVFAEGFGTTEVGSGRTVNAHTPFMIGSTTKALTTLMMARLVDQGKMAWSTPVTTLLPGFSLADAEVTRQLEIRHTVSASTGMARRDIDFLFRTEGVTPEDRMAEMRAMSPTTGFGETFQYSNHLVAAGGYAAARAFAPAGLSLQKAYELAMEELVFQPISMSATGLAAPSGNERAEPHGFDFEGDCVPIDPTLERFVTSVAPAGALWSTAIDLAKYLQLELNQGQTAAGEPLLRPESLAERSKPGIKITADFSYGLGLFRENHHGLLVLGHGGNTLGFSSDLYFLPEHGIGAVLLTNRRNTNLFLAAVRQKIFELLFDAPRSASQTVAAAQRSSADAVQRRHARVQSGSNAAPWLAELAGQYRCAELGPLTIAVQNGVVSAQFQSWKSPLGTEIAQNAERFVVLTSAPWSGELRLRVLQATRESGQRLLLDGGQIQYTFERVAQAAAEA